MENGTPVRVSVEKMGMEVVNLHETEQVILGRTHELRVVMADARKLADAQQKFYNVAVTSITGSFERRMRVLRDTSVAMERRLLAINAELNDTIGSLGEAMSTLSQQRDAALQHVRDIAHQFATDRKSVV